MSKRRKNQRPAAKARFKVGDLVRVKQGVRDAEYPEIALGGWAGAIAQVHRDGIYTVRWSRQTRANIHPLLKKWCERDGLILEENWLGDEDLLPDPGGPLAIDEPKDIASRPLSIHDQSDRVRTVFGLTSDDPLPEVDEETLETYYDFLADRLTFPFEARYLHQEAWFKQPSVRVVNAVGLDEDFDADEGIFCKALTSRGDDVLPLAHLEVRRSDPNHQRVDDYKAWFFGRLFGGWPVEFEADGGEEFGEDEAFDHDNRPDSNDEPDGDEGLDGQEDFEERADSQVIGQQPGWLSVALLYSEIVAFAVSYGAVVGSAVAVMPWARWAGSIVGGLWGVAQAASTAKSAPREWSLIVPRFRKALGGLIGLIMGAVTGAFFGIMVVALTGALMGAILGLLFKRFLALQKRSALHVFPGSVLFCAGCGVAAQAAYLNPQQAADGLLYGALAGLAGGLFLSLASVPLAFLTINKRVGWDKTA